MHASPNGPRLALLLASLLQLISVAAPRKAIIHHGQGVICHETLVLGFRGRANVELHRSNSRVAGAPYTAKRAPAMSDRRFSPGSTLI